jgi:molybdopterin molybdotransferase
MTASSLVELEQAREMVLARTAVLPGERVQLDPGALDRVLARDVVAAASVPAFDNSAMDGFAVRAGDVRDASCASPVRLALAGESRAGSPAGATLAAGEAIAVSTGAMLPAGADTVVRREDAERRDGRVEIRVAPAAGRDVRRAGDDVAAGDTVLTAGTRLGPVELGVLASLGCAEIDCVRRPRVSVLVSGDELLAPGEPMRPGGVRDTSTLAIAALAMRAGADVVSTRRVPDEPQATRAALAGALDGADMCIVCGGVSVGDHDHVRPSLQAVGAEQVLWGLALRPGRPLWFGTHGSCLVFGLPGNPVSAVVTFVLLVAPALRALLGQKTAVAEAAAILDDAYEKRAGRAHALRCRLSLRDDGWHARLTGPQGSHVLTSLLAADALALIPTAAERVQAGERVHVEPLRPLPGMLA